MSDLAWDTDRLWLLLNAVMNKFVPQNAWNFLTSRDPVSFSGKDFLAGVS